MRSNYLIRIAGDLQFNLNHGTPELPKLAQPSLLSFLSTSVASALASLVQSPVVGVAGGGDSGEVQLLSPLQKFARAAATIEAERVSMRNMLKVRSISCSPRCLLCCFRGASLLYQRGV